MKSYSGVLLVEAPYPLVWEYLLNPEEIGAAMPDVVNYVVESPTHLKAKVRVGVGPVRAVLDLAAEIQASANLGQAHLAITGGGMGNGVQLESHIAVSEEVGEGGSTRIEWTANVTVSGPLAALGARLLDNQVKKTTEQVFDNIHRGIVQKLVSP